MVKILIQGVGWVYLHLHIVLNWFTKKITRLRISFTSKADDWLNALNSVLNSQSPYGIRDALGKRRLCLISDNSSQPTSLIFIQTCKESSIKQIFTSYNNPKGKFNLDKGMDII